LVNNFIESNEILMTTHCGYVAIIGRPNVGKSTLLNRILQQKISITSRKPQTTRHQILGIRTLDNTQVLYVDTPGLHQKTPKAINRVMNKAALSVIHDVDVVVFMTDGKITPDERWILTQLEHAKSPVILAINKIDQTRDKAALLPVIEAYAKEFEFTEIMPISAKHGTNVEGLETKVASFMPEAKFLYAEDEITDKSMRFMVAEIIREKLMRMLGQELPYAVAIEVEQYKENPETEQIDIHAAILVERDTQKAIVIGKGGEKLKQIGRLARLDINELIGQRCHLKLWVKVKRGWADDERALKGLGYDI